MMNKVLALVALSFSATVSMADEPAIGVISSVSASGDSVQDCTSKLVTGVLYSAYSPATRGDLPPKKCIRKTPL